VSSYEFGHPQEPIASATERATASGTSMGQRRRIHWRDLPLMCGVLCHCPYADDLALDIEDGIDAFDGFQRDG
jgi:hypothetical protein